MVTGAAPAVRPLNVIATFLCGVGDDDTVVLPHPQVSSDTLTMNTARQRLTFTCMQPATRERRGLSSSFRNCRGIGDIGPMAAA